MSLLVLLEAGVSLRPELEPALTPCSLRHFSRSVPVRPMHWLGVALLSVVLLAALPLGEALSLDELLPVLGLLPVVALGCDVDVSELPLLDCANDTVAKPTKAAVTAALIAFNIMGEYLLGGWKKRLHPSHARTMPC